MNRPRSTHNHFAGARPMLQRDMRRKANREKATEAIREIATRHGAAFTRKDDNPLAPRAIRVEVICCMYSVSVSFDGDSKVGAFTGHWHRASFDERIPQLDPSFAWTVDGTPGTKHPHKATTCQETFADFCERIDKGLAALRDGSAFPRPQ